MPHAFFKSTQGEGNRMAKLTEKKVKKVRDLYATGKYTQKQLADRFGVGQATISRILSGKSWTPTT